MGSIQIELSDRQRKRQETVAWDEDNARKGPFTHVIYGLSDQCWMGEEVLTRTNALFQSIVTFINSKCSVLLHTMNAIMLFSSLLSKFIEFSFRIHSSFFSFQNKRFLSDPFNQTKPMAHQIFLIRVVFKMRDFYLIHLIRQNQWCTIWGYSKLPSTIDVCVV